MAIVAPALTAADVAEVSSLLRAYAGRLGVEAPGCCAGTIFLALPLGAVA